MTQPKTKQYSVVHLHIVIHWKRDCYTETWATNPHKYTTTIHDNIQEANKHIKALKAKYAHTVPLCGATGAHTYDKEGRERGWIRRINVTPPNEIKL